jgi:tetratricopeptide (TPR) repeat protein
MSAYEQARLDELWREDGWAPIRKALDIRSFGINAWRSTDAGGRVIPDHEEEATGHEELYLVTAGHATFTIDGEEVDAPAGTILLVRDPAVSRGAVAREPGTVVVTAGGKPGEAYSPHPWETNRDVFAALDAGRPEEAKRLLFDALDRYENRSTLYYNLACAEALLGETDAAVEHLDLALRSRPALADLARDDGDLESIRDDPRFTEIVATAS